MLSNLPPPLGSKTKNRRLLQLNPRSLDMSKLSYCYHHPHPTFR